MARSLAEVGLALYSVGSVTTNNDTIYNAIVSAYVGYHETPVLNLDEVTAGPAPLAEFSRVVDRLPARERAVVLLRVYAQASHREIAETLGVSRKTVALRLAKGRRRLRQLHANEVLR